MTPFEAVMRGLPRDGRGTRELDRAINRWLRTLDKLSETEAQSYVDFRRHQEEGGYP